MTTTIFQGDVFEQLDLMPNDWFDCVVTSPPYWGLRDYNTVGQLGLESTLAEHIDVMVRVFREVRRVLKPQGTLWLNYGDTYATSVNGRSAADTKATGNDDRTFRDKPFSTVGPIYDPLTPNVIQSKHPNGTTPQGRIRAGGYLKPKDLCGVPWRLALALQEDGWWLRQDIIWHKPNPMPESISDRCTKAHEYLFLLAKSERYYFDSEAMKEPGVTPAGTRGAKGSAERAAVPGVNARPPEYKVYDGMRNRRSVWTVPTKPFKEAHFATFPPALIEPCIAASTSEKGCCLTCGKGWVRVTEKVDTGVTQKMADGWDTGPGGHGTIHRDGRESGEAGKPVYVKVTTGWRPSCKCEPLPLVRARVLDPFGGSGTTALVAAGLGRDCALIELNGEYVEMARRRIDSIKPACV